MKAAQRIDLYKNGLFFITVAEQLHSISTVRRPRRLVSGYFT